MTSSRPRPVLATLAFLLVVLALGCQSTSPSVAPSSSPVASPVAAAASTAALAQPASSAAPEATSQASPLPSGSAAVALEDARATWDALHLTSFAYTVRSWNGSGFGAFGMRVTSLEGVLRSQLIDGPAPDTQLGPDTLFAVARAALAAEGTAEIKFDAATGLPTSIRASGPPNAMDADTNIDVSEFVAGPKADARLVKRVKQAVAWALVDWPKAQPATFSYTWTRALASESAPSPSFAVARQSGGASTFSPATTSDGADAASVASVPATLHAVSAALASGAWVDVTTQVGNGVPLLVAVDPTPAAGDAYWIQIAFTDLEREQAKADYRAAMDRWSTAGLARYRYVWHYKGETGTYTYRVTMRGDLSLLTRKKGTAVLWVAMDAGPRLDVLTNTIGQQLSDGGRVVATYDPVLGYPVRVTLVSVNGGPTGTVTISDFTVQ